MTENTISWSEDLPKAQYIHKLYIQSNDNCSW